ncbi:MAG: hypothetical protein HY984_01055 [Candidatus Magasanikbacteria bacterium]|nr:hypothetical protein [Candidatus Magasanikbacteria bacterium]
MNDKFVRHMIAAIGALISLAIYVAGYQAGKQGWWWATFAVAVVYGIVYKLVDA